jgi:hypothetical protein
MASPNLQHEGRTRFEEQWMQQSAIGGICSSLADFAPLNEARKSVRETSRACLRLYTDLRKADAFGRPSFLILPWIRERIESELLNSYADSKPNNIVLTDLPDCHVAVLPFDASCLIPQSNDEADRDAIKYASHFVAKARSEGKLTLAIEAGDSSNRLPVRFDVVLRHSIDRRKKLPGEYCLPGWFDAHQAAGRSTTPLARSRGPRPVVGFCGQGAQGPISPRRRLRGIYDAVTFCRGRGAYGVDPYLLRRKVLNKLEDSDAICCNFVIRDRFFAGIGYSNAKEEYAANMTQSDYVLCVRGYGNFSFRLYDALSNGRIPVLVDTDCVLPFDNCIDYSSIFPVVKWSALSELPRRISAHFNQYSSEQWIMLQEQMGLFYREWLSPKGFFDKLLLLPELRKVVNV